MIDGSGVLDADVTRVRRMLAFAELGKPRVVVMVLITTFVGFYLGSQGLTDYLRLLPTLIGTALAAAGTLALNQYIERDVDAKMQRTRQRPLPDGRLQPYDALAFGVATTLAGLVYLALAVNALSAAVTAFTTVSYLFFYTPLKRHTPLCSIVGAVPGALPPLTGWTAARGAFGVEAWILFAILFLWQLPHSLAIARLYRDDYARAGIRLLPVVEPDCQEHRATDRHQLPGVACRRAAADAGRLGRPGVLRGGAHLWHALSRVRRCLCAVADGHGGAAVVVRVAPLSSGNVAHDGARQGLVLGKRNGDGSNSVAPVRSADTGYASRAVAESAHHLHTGWNLRGAVRRLHSVHPVVSDGEVRWPGRSRKIITLHAASNAASPSCVALEAVDRPRRRCASRRLATHSLGW